jgi:pyruvate/2-oxoglutarate dehydrogenase complex dihydrolipoamide dehydrogenase (E3) component
VEELEPDRIGLNVGRGGIAVDDRQRTNVDGVWAAGDVVAGPMFTPIAQ